MECLLSPESHVDQCPDCALKCKCQNSNTVAKSKHKPFIYAFCLVALDGTLLLEESKFCYEGNAHVKLLERLLEIENELEEILTKEVPMEILSKNKRLKLLANQDFKCNHCDINPIEPMPFA